MLQTYTWTPNSGELFKKLPKNLKIWGISISIDTGSDLSAGTMQVFAQITDSPKEDLERTDKPFVCRVFIACSPAAAVGFVVNIYELTQMLPKPIFCKDPQILYGTNAWYLPITVFYEV